MLKKLNYFLLGLVLGLAIIIGIKWRNDGDAESNYAVKSNNVVKRSEVENLYRISKEISVVARHVIPSVVNISTIKVIKGVSPFFGWHPFFDDRFFNDDLFRRFFGIPRGELKQRALGSGVIISPNGIIITNNHVVERANEIKITLYNKKSYECKVIGRDKRTDIAVIKIKKGLKAGEKLPAIKIGDSSKLQVGELVLAIGNPFGLGHTVTLGIVSAKGRSGLGIVDYEDFIQTDAAINPGNSGGALVNIKGELIGINTAIITKSGGYQGIGFAIPSNMAMNIAKQLIKTGKIERSWIGVYISDLNEQIKKNYGIKVDKGVIIVGIAENSPASRSGLRIGDVIVKVDDKNIENVNQLRNYIMQLKPGTKIIITVVRGDRRYRFAVITGKI
jgi:serine protease Do